MGAEENEVLKHVESHRTQGTWFLNDSMEQRPQCALFPTPPLNIYSHSIPCWTLTWVRKKVLSCQTTEIWGSICFIWWNHWFFIWLKTAEDLHLLINVNHPLLVGWSYLPHPLLLMYFFFLYHQYSLWLSKFTLPKKTGKIANLDKYPGRTCRFANSNTKKVLKVRLY